MSRKIRVLISILLASTFFATTITSATDRGIPTSMFGTFIKENEQILYLFYEYGNDSDAEYSPGELGFIGAPPVSEAEFLGEVTFHEALIYYGYAISDRLMFEFEAAVYEKVELIRDPNDATVIPGLGSTIEESGFGSVQAELRYFMGEGRKYFGYSEVEFPFQKNDLLIGAQDWEIIQGFGIITEYSFGTVMGRMSIEYDAADDEVALSEYAIEWVRDLQSGTRLYGALEGEDDEISFIGEIQLALTKNAILKLNTGIGLTPKAEDIAPEVGVMWTF